MCALSESLVVALLLVVSCSAALSGTDARETRFYVATNGNDSWSGGLEQPNAAATDGPFATIVRAQQAVRSLDASVRPAGPVTVYLRGGRYELTEPLVFGPQDSGRPDAPMVYAAYRGETPVISGGRRITGWVQDGDVWRACLPQVAEGEWYFRQLFVNGRRAQRARGPNDGFLRVNGAISMDDQATFTFREGDIKAEWAARSDVEVIALQAWAEIRMPIIAVDESAKLVTLAGKCAPSNREENARYWVENAPELLDAPGEWYLDRGTGEVTYWPLPGEEIATAEVIAPALTGLVRIQGDPSKGEPVSSLQFRGLTFAHTDWTLGPQGYTDMQAAYDIPAAFSATGATSVSVSACRFEHLGGYAISFGMACKANEVIGCEIADVGAGGIKIGEPDIRTAEAEQTHGNRVLNNDLHDIGHVYPAAVGVWVGQSAENTIAGNNLHDTYYSAISVGWTWGYGETNAWGNVIERNHVHDIGRGMLSDMGGIYTLGVQPGTVIRNNVFHDITSDGYGGWGIYLDEGSTGILVEGNIVYNTKSGGFHQHYGKENVIRNNIFAFSDEGQVIRSREEPHLSFTFEHNIVYWRQGELLGGNWNGDGYLLDSNVYWNASGAPVEFAGRSLADWQASGQDVHSIIADPLFVAPDCYDFRLQPGSPALAMGFEPVAGVERGVRLAERRLLGGHMGTECISLDGEWSLRWREPGEGEEAGWPSSGVAGTEALAASVPGMTHLDLLRAGKIPEPLFGRNAEDLEWMETKDWWYSTTFALTDEIAGEHLEIVFEGLDCHADVWVNGAHLGSANNSFVAWTYDITGCATPGENLVVVRLDTGYRWALEQNLESHDAYTFGRPARDKARLCLRHCQCSFQWDHSPRLLTAGIWKSVRVERHRLGAVRDLCLRSRLGPKREAIITALLEVELFGDELKDALIEFQVDGARGTSLRYTLVPGFNLITHEFVISDPVLWLPNGYGEPHLYSIECRVSERNSGEEIGVRTIPFGIREISIAQEPLPGDEGQSFTFVVNGVPIFAKGADWVPTDSLLSRVTPEKYETLIRDACGANFNMLRVWGGGTYEADAFWEACDRLGILVWLDFQFACSTIPDENPDFVANVTREAKLVVRRLRNHASLALWCGNNENQWLHLKPKGREVPFGGFRVYHEILPKTCAHLDPTRPYWPSSPYGGVGYNDDDIGDTHSWQVSLAGQAPGGFSDYPHYRYDRSKFVSEYGFLAPPVRESLAQALPEEEIYVGSPAWQFHANLFEGGVPGYDDRPRSVLSEALERLFGLPADAQPDLDTFLALTQAWQAEAYRYTLSHFRRRKFLTSGTLLWMYSDCWVATSGWSVVDYFLRRKPSYYAVRRAYAPEMVSFSEDEDGLSIWLVNDRLQAVDGVLEFGIGRLSQPETRLLGRASHVVSANSSQSLLAFRISDYPPEEERGDSFFWARWLREGEIISWQNHWLVPWGDVALSEPGLEWSVSTGEGEEHLLRISAKRYAWMVELSPRDGLDFEDNYFDLAAGETRQIRISGPAALARQVSARASNQFLPRFRR